MDNGWRIEQFVKVATLEGGLRESGSSFGVLTCLSSNG